MSRWINEEWLKSQVHDVPLANGAIHGCVDKLALIEAPSIEIIRCRECKHFHEEGITSDKDYYCERCHDSDGFWREVKPDDFCSYGVRKTERSSE